MLLRAAPDFLPACAFQGAAVTKSAASVRQNFSLCDHPTPVKATPGVLYEDAKSTPRVPT